MSTNKDRRIIRLNLSSKNVRDEGLLAALSARAGVDVDDSSVHANRALGQEARALLYDLLVNGVIPGELGVAASQPVVSSQPMEAPPPASQSESSPRLDNTTNANAEDIPAAVTAADEQPSSEDYSDSPATAGLPSFDEEGPSLDDVDPASLMSAEWNDP